MATIKEAETPPDKGSGRRREGKRRMEEARDGPRGRIELGISKGTERYRIDCSMRGVDGHTIAF